MSTLNLPYSMVADRDAGIKANAQHVDDDFNAVKTAVDGKLDLDGTSVPTADISMGSHKITGVATPTASGDAATKGYVDSNITTLSGNCVKLSGNQTIAGTKTFSASPVVPAPTNNTDAATKKYVDDGLAGCVKTSGNQTIAGTKTFSSTIQGNISGSSGSCTGNAATATSATKATQDGNGNNIVNTYAPKASPAFTGTPTAPTVSSVTDNSTKIATTHFVLDVLKAIYPVDSIYIGTGTTCPLASLFGSWTRIDAGLALWTGNGSKGNGSTVTTTSTGATNKISAGLPNITGGVSKITSKGTPDSVGALYSSDFVYNNLENVGGSDDGNSNINIDASRSSSIYGASSTVQPPAYVVNVWRRTA